MSFPAAAPCSERPIVIRTTVAGTPLTSTLSPRPASPISALFRSGVAPSQFNNDRKLVMLLFKLFNPKSLAQPKTPAKDNQNHQTKATSKVRHPRGLAASASSSSFFHYNGLGEVLSPISPDQSGRIHFCGTDWPAQLCPQRHSQTAQDTPPAQADCILAGRTVQVVGRQGITLLVATM